MWWYNAAVRVRRYGFLRRCCRCRRRFLSKDAAAGFDVRGATIFITAAGEASSTSATLTATCAITHSLEDALYSSTCTRTYSTARYALSQLDSIYVCYIFCHFTLFTFHATIVHLRNASFRFVMLERAGGRRTSKCTYAAAPLTFYGHRRLQSATDVFDHPASASIAVTHTVRIEFSSCLAAHSAARCQRPLTPL